jgi:hypothetical protein
MFLHRIQHRLIFLFVLLVVAILFISGWTLHWMIRQSLEVELGRKLVAVANAASAQFEEDQVGYLMQSIGPRTIPKAKAFWILRRTSNKALFTSIYDSTKKNWKKFRTEDRPTPFFFRESTVYPR